MSYKKETDTRQHLRVVTEIADILDKEYPNDPDAMFFIVRTLRNIFLWENEDAHNQHIMERAIDNYNRKRG